MTTERPVVVASYRGPINAGRRSAAGAAPKGAGGLIQVLQPWIEIRGALWVFADDSGLNETPEADEDRPQDDPLRVAVAIDEERRHQHYDIISNSILWPLFHGLEERAVGGKDLESEELAVAWEGFRHVNSSFATAIADCAPPGSIVVAHDYQLLLVPGVIRSLRPDLKVGYFHHIPFTEPDELRRLPEHWRREIVASLAGGPSGFQAQRWVEMYRGCCADEDREDPATFVAPVHADTDGLKRVVDSTQVRQLRSELRKSAGDMQLVARVDRADPMKNVLGGVRAIDLLLSEHPEWMTRAVFAHHLVPTRSTVPGYGQHLDEILKEVEAVNDKWARQDWKPIEINVADERERGLALLAEYDVLLVNPIREGMNLIAHEGPTINTRDGVLVLSREAGSYDTFSDAALGIDPRSEDETAAALHRALSMPKDEREDRAGRLRKHLDVDVMQTWHDDIVAAVASQ